MILLLFAACTRSTSPAGHSATPDRGPLVFADGRTPTNLLVITLDTTRRDRIGRFSGRGDTTPFLDARMAEGVVLEDHRSCSNWTAPSMICATTGNSPYELGFWPGSGDPEVPSDADLRTVAKSLSHAGYGTTLITGNRIFSDVVLRTAQGFGSVKVRDYAPAEEIAALGRTAVADRMASGDPWYVHLHFMDPHRPYCPPQRYLGELDDLPDIGVDVCDGLADATERYPDEDASWQQALLARVDATYRAELRSFDDQLASLWADLDASGALDDTLVVFATDHGEQQMERGVIDHGFELYAEENRSTAAFWAKGLSPRVWTGPTLHTDLAVTLWTLYGLEVPEKASGLVLGAAPADRPRRVMAYSRVDHGPPQLGIVEPGFVLHYDFAGGRAAHRTDADPAELSDVYDAADPQVIAAWREMSAFVDDVQAAFPSAGVPVAAEP
ncbi:MAG: sulfatase-like hydrolase/transferase [Alphaproteobacteria bacterium]|nr:sulfatase-like hydrolase/transferase [Alphaproteobacteria bacterium]